MPSRLLIEEGETGTAHSSEREEVVSYDEAFRRELVEFSECIRTGREARTHGLDGARDIELCEAIAMLSMGVSLHPAGAP
jgi:predicted dehydrogenase